MFIYSLKPWFGTMVVLNQFSACFISFYASGNLSAKIRSSQLSGNITITCTSQTNRHTNTTTIYFSCLMYIHLICILCNWNTFNSIVLYRQCDRPLPFQIVSDDCISISCVWSLFLLLLFFLYCLYIHINLILNHKT